VALLIFIMLRAFEYSQVYHPDRNLTATGAELGFPFENATFTASDGVLLHGWFYPALPAPASSAAYDAASAPLVILLCHGNAGNISHRLDTCAALLTTGVSVFLFDYRGYGRSQGRPSEEGTYRDAQAAHQWLERKGFPGKRIVVLGESLGGGVASELALRAPVAGLVLQSTFTSIPDVGAELFPWLPVRLLASIKYATASKLPRLKVPVLVMHSRTDELVAFHHATRNFAAANQPKLFWELKGEHNDALGERENFIAGIRQFLQMVESGAR
jgi:pimeloyl-ACP methyl ester carboxylesterase